MNKNGHTPRFGDIFYARLESYGSVQGGVRPVIISQNDMANKHSPVVTVMPLSKRIKKASHLPVHVVILANEKNGLDRDSVALAEQTRPIPKSDLGDKLGSLEHEDLKQIGRALRIQMPFPDL